MNRPAMLADHLDAETDAIIALWRSTVERVREIPDAEGLSPQEIVDHIPGLLDRLADRLRGQPSDPASEAKKHGRLRWRQGFDANEIVRELNLLRSILMRSTLDFAREHEFDLNTLESVWSVIAEVMNEATAEAVGHFQELSALETREALTHVADRQRDLQAAHNAAAAERAKLQTILQNLPVGVWVSDASGYIVATNREAERLQGMAGDKLEPIPSIIQLASEFQLRKPDGSPYAADELPVVRALRGEKVEQEEIIWPQPDQTRVITVNAAPLVNPAGKVAGSVAVGQDITRRKQVEDELRRQLEFRSALTGSLGEGVVAIDEHGLVTFINPTAERMFGFEPGELMGKNIHEMVHYRHEDGSPYPIEECPLQSVLRTGQTVRGDDVMTRKDGSALPVTFTGSPIVDRGQLIGVVEVFRDITERRRLVADLAASEARFRSIAEDSPVIIWRTTPDGTCDYVNRQCIEFLGAGADEVLGSGWLHSVHPQDQGGYSKTFRAALARREPFEHTFRLRRNDGQYRWVTSRGRPYDDGHGVFLGYLGSCIDITPRVELEAALEQQRNEAEESSSHKSRLLSAISHDARTPLNAVVLASQLLEFHCRGMGNPEVEECLQTIRHSVGNVLDLLGDLLNLTKIDAGAMPAEISRFSLEPVLKETLSSVEPQARLKGLDVQLEMNDLAGAVLETDRSKLKQVLANLLSNAVRYTEQGWVRIACRRREDEVLICVEDTGVGIDPADQVRVFDEFATLHRPGQAPGEGSGLGLAICRRLASLLKGEITLQSTAGKGSTFTIVLPGSVLTSDRSDDEHSAVSPQAAGSGVILIAEDHVTSRQTMAKLLKRMGYRVLEAGNGRDVLTLVRQERPLAVLMDVNMPVMDGVEATLALRADPKFRDLPIYALTGDVSPFNQLRIGEAGITGYLEKPVTWEVLQQMLAALTGSKDG